MQERIKMETQRQKRTIDVLFSTRTYKNTFSRLHIPYYSIFLTQESRQKILTPIEKEAHWTRWKTYPPFSEHWNPLISTTFPDVLTAFNVDHSEFYSRLTQFLFSPSGSKYRTNFHFKSNITCGQDSPSVLVSMRDIIFIFTVLVLFWPSEKLMRYES